VWCVREIFVQMPRATLYNRRLEQESCRFECGILRKAHRWPMEAHGRQFPHRADPKWNGLILMIVLDRTVSVSCAPNRADDPESESQK